MATVTGYTAARMKEIEDSAIVDGDVVDGDLILTRFDGATINAGSVIGPTGPQGPVGEVEEAPLDGTPYARQDGLWVPAGGSTKTAFTTLTGGDITPPINSWGALSTVNDLVLDAVAGDIVGLEMIGRWQTGQAGGLTFFTRVSGANVNNVAPISNYGVISWANDGSEPSSSFGGEWLYEVQAGDISAGTVTFRGHGRSIGASKVLEADTTFPLRLQAKNYGQ